MATQEERKEVELKQRLLIALEDYDRQRTALLNGTADMPEDERIELEESLRRTTADFLLRIPSYPLLNLRAVLRAHGYESLQLQDDLQLVSQEMKALVQHFQTSGKEAGLLSWSEEEFAHFVSRCVALRLKRQLAMAIVGPEHADLIVRREAMRVFRLDPNKNMMGGEDEDGG